MWVLCDVWHDANADDRQEHMELARELLRASGNPTAIEDLKPSLGPSQLSFRLLLSHFP